MGLLKGNKGQLIIYFLVFTTMVAVAWATVANFRMQTIKRQIRVNLVTELKAECDTNMAQCRIASENVEIYTQEGGAYSEPVHIRTKAIRGFIKVALMNFQYSGPARLQWQGFVSRLNQYGILKEDAAIVDVQPEDCKDLYDIYYGMLLFLVKCQANNYNFDF